MNYPIQLSFFFCLLSFVSANATEPLPLSKDYWKDESFLKSFNGSYRVNARIEPIVTTEERGLLVSIQPLMAEGKRKAAMAKLEASPLMKSSAAIAFNAGNIQFELGNLTEAEHYYQSALKTFPSFRRAHRNLGLVFARNNDWDKALPALENALRLGDQDGATYGQLAYGRMHKKQYTSALQAYRLAQITEPNTIDWKVGTAQCLQHLQRNEEALTVLEEVIDARPDEAAYYLLQASIQLAINRQDDAITNLELLRRLGKLDSENHLLLASLHLHSGSSSLARPLMLTALKMEKKPPLNAALNTLENATRKHEWILARDFASMIKTTWQETQNAELTQKLQRLTALIDIDSEENIKRGASTLKKLIQQNPLDAPSLILLARYHIHEKRNLEAETLLEQASRVESSAYQASLELAKLYVATTRYTDAIEQLDKAIKIRPTPAVKTYRAALANLADATQ